VPEVPIRMAATPSPLAEAAMWAELQQRRPATVARGAPRAREVLRAGPSTLETPLTNPLLLVGIAFELVFAALAVDLPAAQALLGTAALDGGTLLLIAPFPLVVWCVDELYRAVARRRGVATLAGRQ